MATLNVSVTQSNVLLTTAVSSGSTLDFVIDNPIPYTSYFTLETVADNNGFYTNSTSKNTSGSFTLGTGQFGLIQSDYMASVVVPSGSTTLRFIPAVNIPANTLYLRGIGAGPYGTITISEFDADYQAILNYATTQGYTLPSAGQQVQQNQLIVDLKAGGVWDKLDTFAVFANDGGSNFGLIDWKRLTLYTAFNSPTFTTNQGFTGNGTSAYINTNFNPRTQGINYTRTDASRYYMHFSGTNIVTDGVGSSSVYNSMRLGVNTTTHTINSASSLASGFTYNTTKGIKSIHRTSSNDVQLFNDKIGASTTQLDELPRSENQLIFRRGTNYSDNTSFGYAMGASLISENNAFVDALNTYINSL